MAVATIPLPWKGDNWRFADGFWDPPGTDPLSLTETLVYILQFDSEPGEYKYEFVLHCHGFWHTDLFIGENIVQISRGLSWRVVVTLIIERHGKTARVESAHLFQTRADGTENILYTLEDDDMEYVENVLLDVLVAFDPPDIRPGEGNMYKLTKSVDCMADTGGIVADLTDGTDFEIETMMADIPDILNPHTFARFLSEHTDKTEGILPPVFWIDGSAAYKTKDYL